MRGYLSEVKDTRNGLVTSKTSISDIHLLECRRIKLKGGGIMWTWVSFSQGLVLIQNFWSPPSHEYLWHLFEVFVSVEGDKDDDPVSIPFLLWACQRKGKFLVETEIYGLRESEMMEKEDKVRMNSPLFVSISLVHWTAGESGSLEPETLPSAIRIQKCSHAIFTLFLYENLGSWSFRIMNLRKRGLNLQDSLTPVPR